MNEITPGLAYAYLDEAKKMNPGPWVEHSLHAAKAARNIAERVPDLDPDIAEAFGYIHDIGRRFGIYKMNHVILGYKFMIQEGYNDAARICLTHSFPTKNADDDIAEWDCSNEDYLFVKQFIDTIEFNEYDELLQLCDALALPNGFTLVERRLVDISLRYGVDNNTIKRWKAFFSIQDNIEKKLGCSIYTLLPGIEVNLLEKPLSESLNTFK